MAWRLHLSNRSIQQLDILPGQPTLLAAWWRRDRVAYYDLETGVMTGEGVIYVPDVEDRNLLVWQEFVRTLKAPNGANLPLVYTPHEAIYLTADDQVRLYRAGAAELFLQLAHGSDEIKLDVKAAQQLSVVALSRKNELIVALDVKGKVHLYRQSKPLGAVDVGLTPQSEAPLNLALSEDGSRVFVADTGQIVRLDATGKPQKRLLTHYAIGRMVCSPDGKRLLTSDLETDVLRVYDGETLRMTHQRFAIDLLADAPQLQLLADLPSIFVGLNAMTLDDAGMIAFALSGILCVTAVDEMNRVPEMSEAYSPDFYAPKKPAVVTPAPDESPAPTTVAPPTPVEPAMPAVKPPSEPAPTVKSPVSMPMLPALPAPKVPPALPAPVDATPSTVTHKE